MGPSDWTSLVRVGVRRDERETQTGCPPSSNHPPRLSHLIHYPNRHKDMMSEEVYQGKSEHSREATMVCVHNVINKK